MFDRHMRPKSVMTPEEAQKNAYGEGYAEGIAEGYQMVVEIVELCALQGDIAAAGGFLQTRASLSDVKCHFGLTLNSKERQVLMGARTNNPLLADAERRLAIAGEADQPNAAALTENPLLADANRRLKAVN